MLDGQFEMRKLDSQEDLAACADMMLQANPWDKLYFDKEQCETTLSHPMIVVHGAVAPDGQIIGFMATMAWGIGLEPMIEFLCIAADFRNLGLGSEFISFFENEMFPEADNLYMFVSDINPNAMRLYGSLGYSMVAALPNFNLESQTEFLYRKSRRPIQLAKAQKGAAK